MRGPDVEHDITVTPWSSPEPLPELPPEAVAWKVQDETEITLDILCAKVDLMQATMDAILAKFDGIASEVGPVVESISSHPLFRMIGGKRNG
jgi:hypothetical protein